MGVHYLRRSQLASAHLALSCPGLPAFLYQSYPAPRDESTTACAERPAFVLDTTTSDGLYGPQFHGGRIVCSTSRQCRVCGLDCRTQEPAEHVVLSARTRGLRMVRAQTASGSLRYRDRKSTRLKSSHLG